MVKDLIQCVLSTYRVNEINSPNDWILTFQLASTMLWIIWFIYLGQNFSHKEKICSFYDDVQFVFDDCRFVILFILMSCFGGCGYYKHKQRLLLMPRDTYVNRGRTSARTTPGLGLIPSHTAAASPQTEPITLQPSISILPPPYSEVFLSQSSNCTVTSTYQIHVYRYILTGDTGLLQLLANFCISMHM